MLSPAQFEEERLPLLTSERPRGLVADDERIIADTLAMILNQNGYEAAPVYGGRLAVEKARHWRPDLFLSDVSMPEMDGIQAAMEICTMFPDCRVLLFSGDPNCRLLVPATYFNAHVFDFIEKPIPPRDLLGRLRKLRVA